MRKLTYLAVFETDDDPGVSLYFPDVPGCVSCGEDFDHALLMAKEALALHIYGIEKDGETPPPRAVKIPRIGAGCVVAPITIYPDIVKDEISGRRVKTTVTIPHWVKLAAEAEGLNYSRLLENAIKETLGLSSCFEPVSRQGRQNRDTM